ncbi:MAG: winged helix-turn-helix domain-containing protein [Acidobacteriota bacterium]
MVVQINKVYLLDKYRLEPGKRLLYLDDAPVHLTPRPFQVLVYLIENRDRVVTRQELFDEFWEGHDVYDDTLRKCVGAIRKALKDNANQARFIETHYAGGYRYIGAVEEVIEESSSVVEVEKMHGVRLVIEEEIHDSLPPEVNQQTVTTSATPVKEPRLSHRAVAFVSLIAVIGLLALAFLRFRNSGNAEPDTQSTAIRSIAVLPLKNLSNDEAQEFFSDGLTETFITELSKIDGLKVISRNSVFTLKGKDIDPREVGKRLDVAAILEGSVRKNGDTVRVDVRLVNTRDGSVIWSGNNYDRALNDILAVQDEIACSVVAGLRVKFCKDAEPSKHYTSNVDAYQAYLKGRFYWNKRTSEGIRRSVDYYEQAIALDPNYALAYAGLADSYIQGIWHVPFDPTEVLPKAKTAALRAIEIDDQLAEIHTALANVYQMEWQWADAEREINRAIALNPGLARAYHVQAFQMDMTGRHEEAVASIKQAQILDPLNLVINADMSFILWNARYADEALTQALKVVEMDPNFAFGHERLYELYLFQGKEEAAAEEYFKTLMLGGRSDAQVLAYRKAFEKSGWKGIAQKRLDERLQDQRQGKYSSLIFIAGSYAELGQPELAFNYLEKAYNQRSAEMGIVKNSPYFAPLHSDPRYQSLLRRIGFSE